MARLEVKFDTHLPQSLVGPEAPATTICLYHLCLCIQPFGETLVLTAVSCRTHLPNNNINKLRSGI